MSEELNMDMDIVTVVDDDGKEHLFEEIDRIEFDDGRRYVALLPIYEDEADLLEDDGEVLILKVIEEKGETYLVQIEDDAEFEKAVAVFDELMMEEL